MAVAAWTLPQTLAGREGEGSLCMEIEATASFHCKEEGKPFIPKTQKPGQHRGEERDFLGD